MEIEGPLEDTYMALVAERHFTLEAHIQVSYEEDKDTLFPVKIG